MGKIVETTHGQYPDTPEGRKKGNPTEAKPAKEYRREIMLNLRDDLFPEPHSKKMKVTLSRIDAVLILYNLVESPEDLFNKIISAHNTGKPWEKMSTDEKNEFILL